jgi:hypothetical protein
VSESLRFDNGYGGFSADGREYVMRLAADGSGRPPMPWSNVIANEHAGFLTTEGGPGLAWARNSRENRLTPWYNDPVADPPAEALFVRDEDGGVFNRRCPKPAAARLGCGTASCHALAAPQPRAGPRGGRLRAADRTGPGEDEARLTNTADRGRRLTIFRAAVSYWRHAG